tara:strand:+ start:1366 stop:2568 length:1203 start_codon:yes stop_codon:yes gene_type:complete
MADETTFASESTQPVEKTELQQLQERLQNYKASLDPRLLQIIQQLAVSQLQNGHIKMDDLDAFVLLRDEVNKSSIDYQTMLQRTQKRMQELMVEQEANKAQEIEELIAEQKTVTAKERVRRKEAEAEVISLQEQVDKLKAELDAKAAMTTKAPSKAFAQARALNPAPDPMESWTPPEIKEFNASGTTTESFMDEVDRVQEVADADQMELDLDPVDNISEQMAKAHEITDDPDLSEKIEDTKKAFKDFMEESPVVETPTEDGGPTVQDEEVQTEYGNFTKPVISNSKLPEIKTYESEEELLAAAQAKIDAQKEEVEEEYEEVTIPERSELQRMTKATIFGEAQNLGFKAVTMSQTKDQMIETFVQETEAFIADLQESGDFVSADIEGEDEDNEDRQDGGYF